MKKQLTLSELKCGYLEKHTNAKHWIEDNKDLEATYKTLSDKAETTIWSEGPSSEDSISVARKGNLMNLATVAPPNSPLGSNQIVQMLCEKHGDDYSALQYQKWARMKLNGKNFSLEEAPPCPRFNGGHKKPQEKQDSLKEALASCAMAVVSVVTGNNPVSNSAHG